EVDKRSRAAIKALGCDPDAQPIYVQIASVPKLLSQGGEASVMQIVRQTEQMAKAEFRVPLVLVVFDTMIKSAGYRKSENDAVEVNNTIQVMENISIRTKCFVLAPFSLKMLPQPAACSSAIWPARSWSRVDTRAYPKVAISLSNFESDFRINKASENSGQETATFCGKTRWCGPGPYARGLPERFCAPSPVLGR